MKAASIVLASCATTCTAGAPPAFSGGNGESWTFPLVGSLEGGPILVPVMVGDRGPYLFAVDPGSQFTVLDAQVVVEGKLRTHTSQSFGAVQITRGSVPMFVPKDRLLAEVASLRVGDLKVSNQTMLATKTSGLFDSNGRRIHGLIGLDVLRDTTTFGFDRDRGLGFITTASAFARPSDAQPIPFQTGKATGSRSLQHVVTASINGVSVPVALDLGARASELREQFWQRAKLESVPIQGVVVRAGVANLVTKQSSAARVVLGSIVSTVSFIPPTYRTTDGALGLDFFDAYDVWLDWSDRRYWVSKREAVPYATRAARWPNSPIARCSNPGCISMQLISSVAGEPMEAGTPHPGLVLAIERDHVAVGASLEVVVEAAGKPELPRLLISLPPDVTQLRGRVGAEF